MGTSPKAIALMSGGLDSTLAAKLVKDQGVEVVGLHLSSPFACRTDIEKNAEAIGVPLLIKEKGKAYLELLEKPKYGYGRSVNPCIDCRIFMFQLAAVIMEENEAHFLVTGEVLGQRPMSQRRDSIGAIDRDSELKGKVLRPLSAHHFPPTEAEEKGWVNRDSFLGISGRSRKVQLELATKMGIQDFDTPGGGCLLTEMTFAPRLRDFFDHEKGEFRQQRSEFLRYGRHFRVSDDTKVVVGRNEQENKVLEQGWEKADGVLFVPQDFGGPSALAFGSVKEKERALIGQLILRYSKSNQDSTNRVQFRSRGASGEFFASKGLSETEIEGMRI